MKSDDFSSLTSYQGFWAHWENKTGSTTINILYVFLTTMNIVSSICSVHRQLVLRNNVSINFTLAHYSESEKLSYRLGMLTAFPLCNFSLEFPEILSLSLKAIIDWVCLGIPKLCIVGYSLTRAIQLQWQWTLFINLLNLGVFCRPHAKIFRYCLIEWNKKYQKLRKETTYIPVWNKT